MDLPTSTSTLPPIKVSLPEARQFWEIPVLYEDEQLLAIDKPVGLAVAAGPHEPASPTLMSLLHGAIAAGKGWATARKLSFLMYAHRLDSEATGVLLLAKSKPTLTRLLDSFGGQQATLSFVTLASGAPPQDAFSVEAKLAVNPLPPGLTRVDPKAGKRAATSFRVVERFEGWVLLECVPRPNRPHQVQVHLARAGLRVAGDQSYGGKPLWLSRLKPDFRLKPGHTERPLISRASVHAARLEVLHPETNQPLLVEAPWPKDLQVGLKYLRRYASARLVE